MVSCSQCPRCAHAAHPWSILARMWRYTSVVRYPAVLAPEPDRVQIALAHLADPLEQLVEVVLLGVQVAAGERVVAAGGELADEFRGELRRNPGRDAGYATSVMSVRTSPGVKKKTGSRPASSFASVSP